MELTVVILVWANILSTYSFVFSASLQQSQTEHRTEFLTEDKDQYPDGDPRGCVSSDVKRLRFEVLPGGGWDNLKNKEMGMVIAQNFTKCLTTDDGEFLIPDGIYTIPMKNGKVETFAELMEHWDNYTSTLSRTLNVEAGLSFSHVGIDAKFSSEYESIKSQQHNEKSMTTRVQARYVRYTVKLQPDTALNSVFRSRLRKIAAFITLNHTENAQYESQLLVRDFGTHVITSVDAGVALVQIEHVRSTYVRKSESQKNTILASASANFFDVFKFSPSYSQTANRTNVQEYLSQRTMSSVMTFGGPVFRPMNYSVYQWSTFVDNDLVTLDRSGDPIYLAITHKTLPDIPQSIVHEVRNYVKDAVYLYYKHNTYYGCTNQNSPNFNFQANVDDGSCLPQKSNFTFGGVYQECQGWGYTDLCTGMIQKNPLTGSYNCPSDFEAVLIHNGSKYSSVTRRECHSCYLFFTCCSYNTYGASARYTAYWCSSVREQVRENSGFLFGGLFTRTTINPLTQAMKCPSNFYQLTILDTLAICVSDNYELGYQYSLPFAGFYSCVAGNPLSMKERYRLLKSSNKASVLNNFLLSSGIQFYPRTCPDGYSQHLAVVDRGCEINYCVKFGSLTALPKLQRPPFMDEPKDDTTNSSYVLNNDGTVWLTMDEAMKEIPQYLHSHGADNQKATAAAQTDKTNKENKSNTLTNGGIAAISVSATLVCVLIAIYIFIKIRRHRNLNGRVFDYSGSTNKCKYGSTSVQDEPSMENT